MFEVGFTEIILIVGLALLVLGPEKLPGLVSKVGRWTGRARSMARQLRTQLEHEVSLEELSKSRPMQSDPQPQANQHADNLYPVYPQPEHDMPSAAADMAPAAELGDSPVPTSGDARPVDLSKPVK
jgi:sec-independent protein translocase protein TatB